MADFMSWQDESEELYTLPENDLLGILTSTKIVVETGEAAWINSDRVEALSKQWVQEDLRKASIPVETQTPWSNQYHFADGTERTINWLLVLDALNFCFWAQKDQPRWTIEYQGETLNGYWAEAAALKRAVEDDNIPLWDANYLSTISEETIAHIFRGQGTIPLFEQRVQHAREVGQVLLTHYEGQFTNAIEQAERDATKLTQLLVDRFSSFRDIATYRNQPITFLKRAQICVADIHSAFGGESWGALSNMDQLTIFADYKLPQVLRHANVLEYQAELAQRVDNQELIAAGSEEEIEIRANTIWACELLRRAMARRDHKMTAAEIDQRLWFMGQQSEEMHPYHRTLTIYY